MDTTKTRICYTAIRLFNEKEYDNVSLREIAEAAGTTIGIPPTTLSRRSFCWKPRRNDIKRIFFSVVSFPLREGIALDPERLPLL